MDRHSSPLVVL